MMSKKVSKAQKKKIGSPALLVFFWISGLLLAITSTSLLGSESEALSDEIDPSLEIEPVPVLPLPAPKPIHAPKISRPSTLKNTTESTENTQKSNVILKKDPTDSLQTKTTPHQDADKTPPADAPPPAIISTPDILDQKKQEITPPLPIKKKDHTPPEPITLLGTEIPPGMATRVAWRPGHSLKGLASQAPVLVVHGRKSGPVLCITAAVHGDELNGIEVVRQVLHKVKASKLNGTLIGVPIVNIQGFLRNSRYLVDRRDLNRFFPGTAHGSLASRIANSFFNQVIVNCSALVDIHTGSFYRDNLPQLRADLGVESVVQLTKGFSSTLVLHSTGARGTLRKAAVSANIPAITLELGGPMILNEKAVEHGVEGIFNLLNDLNMYKKSSFWGTPKPVYYHSQWVRAEHGGIFFSKVRLGDKIAPGELLGTITNPITNEQFLLLSPYEGQVVGLAHNQVVYPGFATTHLAIEPTSDPNQQLKTPEPEKLEID